MMSLQAVLSDLGDRLGVGPIDLDAHRGCVLAFDDDLVVELEAAEDQPGFYLTGEVGPAPSEGRESVFAELLEANLLGQGTGQCCLALDGDLDELVLMRYVDREDIEVAVLEEILDDFLSTLDLWRRRHGTGELGTAGSAARAATATTPRGPGIIRG
jgi:hypothetical protein